MAKYKFTNDGATLTIYECYTYSKKDYQSELNQIKSLHGKKKIFERSDLSLTHE